MNKFLLFLTFITLSFVTNGQTAEDSVKAAVNKLFEGIKNSDAALLGLHLQIAQFYKP